MFKTFGIKDLLALLTFVGGLVLAVYSQGGKDAIKQNSNEQVLANQKNSSDSLRLLFKKVDDANTQSSENFNILGDSMRVANRRIRKLTNVNDNLKEWFLVNAATKEDVKAIYNIFENAKSMPFPETNPTIKKIEK